MKERGHIEQLWRGGKYHVLLPQSTVLPNDKECFKKRIYHFIKSNK
ncbi:type II DNA modification enzyme [Staphylococcus aureus]|uniref:Type II DNA modification enzyme n=1 Tax=Staphylococcus aureus TaxID=1280 RepID=A0A380DR95_STAAU|nr:type II DNA modification enzyme [Staphylococcus aureus]